MRELRQKLKECEMKETRKKAELVETRKQTIESEDLDLKMVMRLL